MKRCIFPPHTHVHTYTHKRVSAERWAKRRIKSSETPRIGADAGARARARAIHTSEKTNGEGAMIVRESYATFLAASRARGPASPGYHLSRNAASHRPSRERASERGIQDKGVYAKYSQAIKSGQQRGQRERIGERARERLSVYVYTKRSRGAGSSERAANSPPIRTETCEHAARPLLCSPRSSNAPN